MKKYLLPLLGVFVLGACAFDVLDKGLPRLQGQHVDVAIKYLGLPDAEQKIAGRKVYIWEHQKSGLYSRPVSIPTSQTAYSPYGSYTVHGTSTTYVTDSYNYNCKIKLIVSKNDFIQSSEYEGNEGGCQYFAKGIEKFISDTEPKTEVKVEKKK